MTKLLISTCHQHHFSFVHSRMKTRISHAKKAILKSYEIYQEHEFKAQTEISIRVPERTPALRHLDTITFEKITIRTSLLLVISFFICPDIKTNVVPCHAMVSVCMPVSCQPALINACCFFFFLLLYHASCFMLHAS